MSTIIAGKYKGRKIRNKNLKNVRPTQAKIKKSIFQILEPIENKVVLDLYSGTGSIGLEFLSRGAKHVVMVEKSRFLANSINNNVNKIHNEKNFNIICSDVDKFLDMKFYQTKYDIIFADPPYHSTDFYDLKKKINFQLIEQGIFCMEMYKTNIDDQTCDVRLYGKTQVVIWKK